jgi:hypothetical protein
MFSLSWWMVHGLALFFLLPFALTAPTDGTRLRLHTRLKASDTLVP